MSAAHIINHPNTEFLLMTEINKLKSQLQDVEQRLRAYKNKKQITILDGNMHKMVAIDDIIMIQACSNYSTIYLSNGHHILTSKTLKHWEITCRGNDLVRIHKSFLVNKSSLLSIDVKSSIVILSLGLKAKYSRMSKSVLIEMLC